MMRLESLKSDATITSLVDECHAIAVQHGFWDSDRNDGELIALMHSELSEALEVMRETGIEFDKEKVGEELADCVIRIFDFCGGRNIDLQKILYQKIEVNKKRAYRHGKKF